MQAPIHQTQQKHHRFANLRRLLFLCIIGIAVNLLGSELAVRTGLPIYLDSIGTIFSAALGGYIPGIIVGLLTNLIKTVISDPSSLFYASLNVLIALCTAWFTQKGLAKKLLYYIPYVLSLALIGGGLGTILGWFTEYNNGTGFSSLLVSGVLWDLLDKVISVCIVFVIVRLIPQELRDACYVEGWQQTPLSAKARETVRNSQYRLLSLRTKILALLVIATLIIAVIATGISFMLYREATIREYTRLGEAVAGLAAGILDPEKVNQFLEEGQEAEGYEETKKQLYHLFKSSSDIEYIYAYQIREDGCHVVFDLDTEQLQGSPVGEVIPFDESFEPLVPKLLAGEHIDPIITNDTYGWLLTAYLPVYDSTGTCVCYMATDITMSTLVADEMGFFVRMVSLFFGFFILVLSVGLWLAEYNLILPVNSMSVATDAFAYNSEEVREENVDRIARLNIHTGDEIEHLYHAITHTTKESMQYVADLQRKTEAVNQMQNGLILVLADMVESRDNNTGEHVRKTAAYTRITMQQMKAEGFYADQLTDQFIHDVYHSAPLHDVGKITISDTILNKPGKLTDEEYTIMKTHTTAGRKIISQVIDLVPEPDFLLEARNLAAHHHERWDGRGYPDGLAGEDIPLSARIMAVADVFDALVSKRVYKDGFPFEKSIAIIEEGAGTQFDPLVAAAFVHAGEKAREIAASRGEGILSMDDFNEL